MYGDVLTKSRYSDGKNYYLNNWYGVDPDASAGVLMRRDLLLAEIVEGRRGEKPRTVYASRNIWIFCAS